MGTDVSATQKRSLEGIEMEQVYFWGITIAVSLFFAGVLYLIAAKRGARKGFWAVMGFLFGPLAIPFVFFAKKERGDGP